VLVPLGPGGARPLQQHLAAVRATAFLNRAQADVSCWLQLLSKAVWSVPWSAVIVATAALVASLNVQTSIIDLPNLF